MGHFSGKGWVGKREASGSRGVSTRCLKGVWVGKEGRVAEEKEGCYELIERVKERQSEEE